MLDRIYVIRTYISKWYMIYNKYTLSVSEYDEILTMVRSSGATLTLDNYTKTINGITINI